MIHWVYSAGPSLQAHTCWENEARIQLLRDKRSTLRPDPAAQSPSLNSLTAPVNVTIRALKANSAVVSWDIPEGDPIIGFAITQQKKDVRMLRFIQEVNTTTRSCALWDLEEETDYIVHVQYLSMSGPSPPSEALLFRTPKEAEQLASKSKGSSELHRLAGCHSHGHNRSRKVARSPEPITEKVGGLVSLPSDSHHAIRFSR
ncbi:hypothetical protein COCON_G00000850 [Conger conger]|uniref:Fibronectin type-III domain-containing protein n=1 Tax=Conger conger TaxID=82655 RepID=A0A9Q1E0J6_CONCO|nr:hypothetical protein COCON_G00000850 [Conger conger]